MYKKLNVWVIVISLLAGIMVSAGCNSHKGIARDKKCNCPKF